MCIHIIPWLRSRGCEREEHSFQRHRLSLCARLSHEWEDIFQYTGDTTFHTGEPVAQKAVVA